MLLRVVHHLKNDSPLPRHANAARRQSLQKFSGGFRGIEALTRGNTVRWRCGHSLFSETAASRLYLGMKGQVARDVIVHNHDEEQQEEHQPHLHEALFESQAEVPPPETLQGEQ